MEKSCSTCKFNERDFTDTPCSCCHWCDNDLPDDLWIPADGETIKIASSYTTSEKADELRRICSEEIETFIRKNTDYGDSFANLRREIPSAVLVRIYDKYSRLKQLMSGATAQVSDESIDDTLADLANYANMELLERRLERMK